MLLYEKIESICKELEKEFDLISVERKEILLSLQGYISQKLTDHQTPKLLFVCTHNSRRSQIAQIWLATIIDYFQLPHMDVYSGGSEATAFNIRAVNAFQRIGFGIQSKSLNLDNPIYQVRWQEEMKPYQLFSKKYNSPPNPKEAFAAIMVCSQADEECPLVNGCDYRIVLPHQDPKEFDDTNFEKEKYDKSLKQIGREILFMLDQVKKEK